MRPAFRPDARFVVHLIATATRAPQTRTHRRAAVDDVVTTYADASAREKTAHRRQRRCALAGGLTQRLRRPVGSGGRIS